MHVFLFGGTTEGRKIAEAIAEVNREWAAHGDASACEAGEPLSLPFCAEVYVATAYGASLLPAGPGITVHVGRLDAAEMRALFEAARQTSGPLLVVDATHPYAAVVSENILSACAAAGVRCIRVERESTGAGEAELAPEGAALHWVDSIEEAAAWLAAKSSHRPNILITTGSKELAPYTRIPDFAARCYVRALPTVEALEKCQALGFRRAHLILMQGPFSEEMNVAQLRYADAGYLVTKASGETGGFPEKCEAALTLGVEVVCIGRPKEVSIPDAAWYDREKLDAVLRRIREIGSTGTCESSSEDAVATCESSRPQ
ncbi:MAG: precorrin-6A reductase [Lachnospiraceae bacterium]|nr:precorrin-6A reductase [Lachnospiraceae bacterium]